MSAYAWTSGLAAAFLGYFLLARTGSFLLNLLSIRQLRDIERDRLLADLPQLHSGLEQPISVLLPLRAQDDTATAVAAIRALLQLEHAAYELIVVHSGNAATLDALTQAFDLHPFPETYRIRIPTPPVRGIHRSTRHRQLRVIDTAADRIADALNTGINAARFPLCCSVDTGMLLRRDCLQQLAAPFVGENGIVVTVAALRAANDAAVIDGLLERPALPRRWLPRLQMIELLHGGLFAPLGWSACNAMPQVSSGLMLLRTDVAVRAGGFDTAAIDPHTELLMRVQRTLRNDDKPHGLRFVAEPVCTRTLPDSWPTWRRRQAALQRGWHDALWRNLRWRATRAGFAGWLAYPFALLCGAWRPLIETCGYLFMLAALAGGLLPVSVFGAFLTVAIGFGVLLSLTEVLLEEMSLRSYPAATDAAMLALAAIVFHLGYAQLEAGYRAFALLRGSRAGGVR